MRMHLDTLLLPSKFFALHDETPPSGVATPPVDPNAPKPPAADPAAPKPPKNIVLSQEELDEIIEGRLSRDRKVRKAAEPDGDTAAELETLRQEKKSRERQALIDKGNYEAALKSTHDEYGSKEKKWTTERDTLLGEIRHDRVTGALTNQLIKAEALNPEVLAIALERRADLDEDRRVRVLREDGEPWFKNGKPMGLADLVAEFKDRNPWAFKAAGDAGEPGGLGGGNSTGDEGGDPKETSTLSQLEADYKEKHERAKASVNQQDILEARKARKALEDFKERSKKKKAA